MCNIKQIDCLKILCNNVIMLKIIKNPNEILRRKSVEITDFFSNDIKSLIPQMKETMVMADGIGLAAPQIGKNIRLICINTENGPIVAINPKTTNKSFFKEWGEEGCLSVPGIYGNVKRHKNITVEYFNESGGKVKIKAKGLFARVFQHEIDHLDGLLFIDLARNIHNS